MTTPIRVMIVDDHGIVREGLAALIKTDPGLLLVASLDSGQQALEEYDQHAPDVVLLDLRMPTLDGIGTLERLKKHHPGARVLMLSSHAGDDAIAKALAAGALGYVLKTMSVTDILASIHAARRGRVAPHPTVAGRLAQRVFFEQLSDREVEVLTRVAQGESNKEIASVLGISESTVKNHINHIMSKLNASDRTQAVTIAVQRGILDLGG